MEDRMAGVTRDRDRLADVLQTEREAWMAERQQLATDRAARPDSTTERAFSERLAELYDKLKRKDELLDELYEKLNEKEDMNAEALELLEVNQLEIGRLEAALAEAKARVEIGAGSGRGGLGGFAEDVQLDEAPEVTPPPPPPVPPLTASTTTIPTTTAPRHGDFVGQQHLSVIAELETKLALAEERAALTEEKLSRALESADDSRDGEASRTVHQGHVEKRGAYMHGVGACDQVHALEVTLKNLVGGFATRERKLTEDLERVRGELRGTQDVLGTLQETRLYAKETVKSMTEHLVNVMIELEVDPEEALLSSRLLSSRRGPIPAPASGSTLPSSSLGCEPASSACSDRQRQRPPPWRSLGSLEESGEELGEERQAPGPG